MGQRSVTASDLAGRCKRCWMLSPHCMCSRIPLLRSEVSFLVLRHAKERWRSTNTARIAALALPETQIVDYGVKDRAGLDLSVVPKGAYVLFPGPEGAAFSAAPSGFGGERVRIVVPDGNWRQAGRLARRLLSRPDLRPLALIGVERAKFTLRRTPVPGRLSTIEAMAGALDWAGEIENAEQLRATYRIMVEASVAGRGGRNLDLLGVRSD